MIAVKSLLDDTQNPTTNSLAEAIPTDWRLATDLAIDSSLRRQLPRSASHLPIFFAATSPRTATPEDVGGNVKVAASFSDAERFSGMGWV